jgi:hypothetical protein
VLLEHLFARLDKLHAYKFEAFGLKSLDDVTNESSLNPVWFDHDERSFSLLLFISKPTLLNNTFLSIFNPLSKANDLLVNELLCDTCFKKLILFQYGCIVFDSAVMTDNWGWTAI